MPYLRMDVGVSMGAFGEKIKKDARSLDFHCCDWVRKAKIYRSDHPGKAVSSSYIKDIEKNNKIPSEPIIVALAKALDLDYRQLLVDARLEKAPNAAVEDIYKEIFGYTPSPGTTLNTEKQYQIPLIPYASQSEQATEYAGLDLWELPIFDAGMGEPSGWSDHGYPLGFASEYVAMPKKRHRHKQFRRPLPRRHYGTDPFRGRHRRSRPLRPAHKRQALLCHLVAG